MNTNVHTTAANARIPQLLDRKRRLQVHQFGGRVHALLVLVAPGDQDQQARHAGGRDQGWTTVCHGWAPSTGATANGGDAGAAAATVAGRAARFSSTYSRSNACAWTEAVAASAAS